MSSARARRSDLVGRGRRGNADENVRDVVLEIVGLGNGGKCEAALDLAIRGDNAIAQRGSPQRFDHEFLALRLAECGVIHAVRRKHGRQLREREAVLLGDRGKGLVELDVRDLDTAALRALHLNLAYDEPLENLLLDNRARRQRPPLVGGRISLLEQEVLDRGLELALQDDALVDDGGDAVEQHARGSELTILGSGGRAGRHASRGD
jgi:hypothetical protein